MATDPSDAQRSGYAIQASVQTQLSLVSSFGKWLESKTDGDGGRHGIITKVQRRLNTYQQWLLQAAATPTSVTEDTEPWAMDARAQSGDESGVMVRVTGPGSGEAVEITAANEKDAEYLLSDNYLGYMITVCHAFAKAQTTLDSLLQTTTNIDRETSQLRQPPEDTIQAHVRRLRQYNEIKDIGQQLIGLVAENRGVPVRTLYETGEFGVGMPH